MEAANTDRTNLNAIAEMTAQKLPATHNDISIDAGKSDGH